MIKDKKYILTFIIGAMAMLLLFLVWGKVTGKFGKQDQNDYYIITNQIQKMNKLVVIEQNTSTILRTKTTTTFAGIQMPQSDIKVITFTKTNAQVSYDLNKMKIDVDSIDKQLIINELPNADIRIIPNVEIQSVDDSFINRFNDEDIKRITKSAKENAIKNFDQNKLRTEGHAQLLKNLNQIFVLAKALNYKIEDKTGTFDTSKL